MNCLGISSLTSSILKRNLFNGSMLQTSIIWKRNVYCGSCLLAMKNPCTPPPTNQDIPTTIVRPQFRRLKETQKKFQVDDGLPVWLKGGVKDKILYQITLIGVFVCTGMSAHVLYQLIMK